MDWQAQIYLRHDQAQEAATLLQQAVELAPQDPAILIHYSKALRKLGRTAELSAVLAEFKKAAAEDSQRHARKGLFDFSISSRRSRTRGISNRCNQQSMRTPTMLLSKLVLLKRYWTMRNTAC